MPQITLDLTDEQFAWLEAKAKLMSADASASDWLGANVAMQAERGLSRLEKELLRGLESGDPVAADDPFWEALRNRASEPGDRSSAVVAKGASSE